MPTRLFMPDPAGGVVAVDGAGSVDRSLVGPNEAVLSAPMAATLGLRAGDTVRVRFVDGATVPIRVARLLPVDPARGDVALARDTVRAHDRVALGDGVFVPSDRAPATVAAGTVVRDARSYALADYEADARLTDGLVALLAVLAVGYSGLAVANSVAMAARTRRSDLAVQGSAGGTRRQRLAGVLAETATVVGIGAGLGLVVALPPLLGMASGLSEATGTEVAVRLDGGVVLGVAGGCLALALLASATVTARAMRPS